MGDGPSCSSLIFRDPPHSTLSLHTLLPVQQEERNNPPGAQVWPGHEQCELVANTALYDLGGKKLLHMANPLLVINTLILSDLAF